MIVYSILPRDHSWDDITIKISNQNYSWRILKPDTAYALEFHMRI